MKTMLALPLLALGLAACQTYPQDRYGGYPDYTPPAPLGQGEYRAIGTEPFWDLSFGRELVFTDRGNNIVVSEPAPPVQRGVAGETYHGRRLHMNIIHRPCSDGMSDRSYPDMVDVTVDGRAYRGCGANSAFFAQTGEDGRDRVAGDHNLFNTNWGVVAINGRPVPRSGHYFNFDRERMSGKLGCNSISASYRVHGATLTAGPAAMTRMMCENNNSEAEGVAVLSQTMTISESGDRLTLANRAGTIELIRAR